ncbi:FAD-dependent oxidoreductase [Demetria terragena]|uniref:FAD-dependent oxidoreductase n=1 Tax=Demetria terragena TaxID=63959 RepID=UPI000477B06E|nr:FAD-dependent oxidoreductase [Demetria terragena]
MARPTLTFDVLVVGAGPAGLEAAVTAAEHGLAVALIDAARYPGGQFWRNAGDDAAAGQHGWSRFTRLRARLLRVEADGRLAYLPGHDVWFVEPCESGYRLHLSAPTGTAAGPGSVAAPHLVLCPGGYDRQLPVPGWDLPGVMSAGGVQALLKGHRTLAGKRAVIAGTGPFLLPVATGLAAAGAEVVALCEAGSPARWARNPRGALSVPSKGIEALGYALQLARQRIRYQTRTVVSEVFGDSEVAGVRLSRLDRHGELRADAPTREIAADVVAFGWGFTPSLELITAVGASTRVDIDESLVVAVDAWQRTDVAGVYAAGEATGVGGSVLAQAEGRLAGLAVARDTGHDIDIRDAVRTQSAISRHRAFAAAMHRAHPIPEGWRSWLREDTVLCRCEEVQIGDVEHVRDLLGASDARTVKLLARPGMGWCQGRICGFATAKLATGKGRPLAHADLAATAKRTLAAPVSLTHLASEHGEPPPAS